MEALGIDLLTIIFQIVNFAILVFVLNKFLYKPVLKAIKAKNSELAEIEKTKSKIEKERETAERELEMMMKTAQKDKAEVLRAARAEASKLKKDTLEKAQKQAKDIIAKAKAELDADKRALAKQYEKDLLDTSFAIVQKILGKDADSKLGELKRAVKN